MSKNSSFEHLPHLKVWWVPQIPGKSFEVYVNSVVEAKLLMNTLANYDQFQLDNNIKPDYCNAGGLQILEEDGWFDWYSDDGEDIDFYTLEQLREKYGATSR